jgi:hypothetical protein
MIGRTCVGKDFRKRQSSRCQRPWQLPESNLIRFPWPQASVLRIFAFHRANTRKVTRAPTFGPERSEGLRNISSGPRVLSGYCFACVEAVSALDASTGLTHEFESSNAPHLGQSKIWELAIPARRMGQGRTNILFSMRCSRFAATPLRSVRISNLEISTRQK